MYIYIYTHIHIHVSVGVCCKSRSTCPCFSGSCCKTVGMLVVPCEEPNDGTN